MKPWFWMIGLFLLVALALGGSKGYSIYKTIQGYKAAGEPVATVSTVVAGASSWQPQLKAVGSVRAERGAELSAEVSGIIESLHFQSGQQVKKGQVLVRLRNDDVRASLVALQAEESVLRRTYERNQKQLAIEAVSAASVETDLAVLKRIRAQVAAQQATLDKRTILAPFSGTLGLRLVDEGQYLNPGQAIANLQDLSQLFVDFSVPQQALGQISVGQSVQLSVAGQSGVGTGLIRAIDPQIDSATRNVKVRAVLTDSTLNLLPGAFVNVEITVGQAQTLLTLPQTAVVFNPYGASVYLVKNRAAASQDKNAKPDAAPTKPVQEAQQVFITTGATRGDQVAVLGGIKAGDVVVNSGQIKLKNGMAVAINNRVQPRNDIAPSPKDH